MGFDKIVIETQHSSQKVSRRRSLGTSTRGAERGFAGPFFFLSELKAGLDMQLWTYIVYVSTIPSV